MNINLLDHGYIKLIESWGSDERIVEAARMSTGKGFLGWGGKCTGCSGKGFIGEFPNLEFPPEEAICSKCKGNGEITGDEKLLRYLWEHKHATPFEMAGLIVEVQAPIFVFREWHRHRTQSFNELSARYTPLPDVNYIPSLDRLMMGSDGKNKQAGTIKGALALTPYLAEAFRDGLKAAYDNAEALYLSALEWGVPKELARVHLPVGRYSRMRASANLRNWLAFMTLRSDKNAQYEIRVYSDALGKIISQIFPRTWSIYNNVSNM